MAFFIDTGALLIIEGGKSESVERIEQPIQKGFRTLGQKENYK